MSPLGVFALFGLVVYGAVYWLSILNAGEGSRGGRMAAVLLTTLPAVAAVPLALLSWYGWAARCDESCDGAFARRWQDHAHAWQWTGQLVLAVAALALAILAVGFVARRHYRAGPLALMTVFACAIAWLAMVY